MADFRVAIQEQPFVDVCQAMLRQAESPGSAHHLRRRAPGPSPPAPPRTPPRPAELGGFFEVAGEALLRAVEKGMPGGGGKAKDHAGSGGVADQDHAVSVCDLGTSSTLTFPAPAPLRLLVRRLLPHCVPVSGPFGRRPSYQANTTIRPLSIYDKTTVRYWWPRDH